MLATHTTGAINFRALQRTLCATYLETFSSQLYSVCYSTQGSTVAKGADQNPIKGGLVPAEPYSRVAIFGSARKAHVIDSTSGDCVDEICRSVRRIQPGQLVCAVYTKTVLRDGTSIQEPWDAQQYRAVQGMIA